VTRIIEVVAFVKGEHVADEQYGGAAYDDVTHQAEGDNLVRGPRIDKLVNPGVA